MHKILYTSIRLEIQVLISLVIESTIVKHPFKKILKFALKYFTNTSNIRVQRAQYRGRIELLS